jgi:GH18 family chitinase
VIPGTWFVVSHIRNDKESSETIKANDNSVKEEDGVSTVAIDDKKEEVSLFTLPEDRTELMTSGSDDFKVIGYFPNWYGDIVDQIEWNKLTHVNYAFAIPTKEGEIRSFPDEALVTKLIKTAHENNVKVGLSVGGWSYLDVPLESTFVEATNTDAKCQLFSERVLEVVDQYGFDGVDMDWEYPRAGTSTKQYEYMMTFLRQGLTARGKFLTVAVVGNGPTADGQSDYILDMLDWVNIMAYDGDNGAGHSPYEFALSCGDYWLNTRGLARNKVVLGVPFYERPNWTSYRDIVAFDETAAQKDSIEFNGTTIYYNGLPTMEAKTVWACENAGGVMIWEIGEDCEAEELSLLNQIYKTTMEYYPEFKKVTEE